MIRTLLLLVALVLSGGAAAHKPSDAYLTVERDGAALSGQWDIALRDLDNAIGLDANGDGDITWRELKSRHAQIAAYALQRLRIALGRGELPAGRDGSPGRHAHGRRVRRAEVQWHLSAARPDADDRLRTLLATSIRNTAGC